MTGAPYNRILIIKLAGIGDILQMTACLEGLRRRYPRAHIAFMVQKHTAEIVATNPLLDEVLPIGDIGANGPASDARAMVDFFRAVGFRRFDLAIVGNKTPWAGALLRLAGIRRVVGFAHPDRRHTFHEAVTFVPYRNRLELHLDLFALAGAERTAGPPCYVIRPADRQQALAVLAELGVPDAYVALAPGGATTPWVDGYARRWAPERYAELAGRLYRQHGLPAVLLGGGVDRPTSARVQAAADSPLFDLTGKLPLGQSAAVLEGARAFAGNDSSLLYLAGAVGTPSVGIFGPTDADECLPVGPFTGVQRRVPCSPCWNQVLAKRSPALTCSHVSCMQAVAVDDVYAAVKPALVSGSER